MFKKGAFHEILNVIGTAICNVISGRNSKKGPIEVARGPVRDFCECSCLWCRRSYISSLRVPPASSSAQTHRPPPPRHIVLLCAPAAQAHRPARRGDRPRAASHSPMLALLSISSSFCTTVWSDSKVGHLCSYSSRVTRGLESTTTAAAAAAARRQGNASSILRFRRKPLAAPPSPTERSDAALRWAKVLPQVAVPPATRQSAARARRRLGSVSWGGQAGRPWNPGRLVGAGESPLPRRGEGGHCRPRVGKVMSR